MNQNYVWNLVLIFATLVCLRHAFIVRPSGRVVLASSVSGRPKVWFVIYICLPSPLLLPGVLFSFFYWYMYFLMGGDPQILILQPRREAGLLLGPSNLHPFHWPLSFPLDPPPPITIHPTYPMRIPWTLSSSPNSDHPLNPTNPAGGLKFVDFHPYWLVGCWVSSSLGVQRLCMQILVEFGQKDWSFNFLIPYFGWLVFEFL